MATPMMSEPCAPWPIDETCLPESWVPNALTPAQTNAVLRATEILWRLTQGRFGLCQITLRPCRKACSQYLRGQWTQYGQLLPFIEGGQWFNFGCGCSNSCGCAPICEIRLPGPVNSIVSVTIDGVTIDPATYRVDNARDLVRISPNCWPDCQKMDLPLTEPGTFGITYQKGIPVPPGGKYAVTAYAIELWKACVNDGTCRLPKRVQSVSREGIEMTMIDPMTFLEKGLTGLRDVDAWILAVNPSGRRDVSRVYSPDLRKFRRTTS